MASRARVALALCAAAVFALARALNEDIGYELLFADSTETVEWECWDAPQLPSWMNGSFVIPAVGQFSFGGLDFQGTLDGFGKLHRFQLSDGKVCERARMMLTGFYNQSHEMGTVAPSMLFDETSPPRQPCNVTEPKHSKYPSCNVDAPNDNTFVNAIKLGDEYLTITDSVYADHIDPINAQVLGKWNWTDKVGHFLHMGALASAHPLRRDGWYSDSDMIMLQIDTSPLPRGVPFVGGYVDVLNVSNKDPHFRNKIWTSPKQKITPYFHSFGVTADFVVLGFTPMLFDMWQSIIGKPMCDAFASSSPLQTFFHIVPLNGSESIKFDVPEAFTYNHVVNSYQNESGVVFDAVTWQDASLWLVGAGAQLAYQRNKTLRDQKDGTEGLQQIYRYVFHLYGSDKGKVTKEPVSVTGRVTDFPKLNMHFSTKAYCIYYGVESFHNDVEGGSQAIVKHNICTGQRQYWYKSSHFPSEPFFVARTTSTDLADEDDGVVVFTVLNGVEKSSYLVVADGRNVNTTLVEQKLPYTVPFTTHGEWFPDMVAH